ncbi:MAG: hypothetical protein AAGB46_02730 [Verrucomicrobiota bacterium]
MRRALVCKGWGGPDASVAALFPEGAVDVVSPGKGWHDVVEASKASVLIGYSTGAFLLLQNEDLWERFEEVVLFAPFEDFKAEAGKGGRVKEAQMKYLLRWLQKDPLAALGDFYARAGLDRKTPTELPYALEDLVWGIERLLSDSVKGDALGRARAFVGAEDALLDATEIRRMYPNVEVIEGATHELRGLLEGSGWSL